LLDSFSVEPNPLVVAVTPVRGDESTNDAVERLLDHIVALPFEVAGLLADRGFYNGASIERLSAVAPVALPIIRRGKQMARETRHHHLLLGGVCDV